MINNIGFVLLVLLSKTLGDVCEGPRFGYFGISWNVYIYEDGRFNQDNALIMNLELSTSIYKGKILCSCCT